MGSSPPLHDPKLRATPCIFYGDAIIGSVRTLRGIRHAVHLKKRNNGLLVLVDSHGCSWAAIVRSFVQRRCTMGG